MFALTPVVDEENTGKGIILEIVKNEELGQEGFAIAQKEDKICVTANTQEGILYGVFELLKEIRVGNKIEGMNLNSKPDKEFRMLNHWDNTDGSIERGYSGKSFFFENGNLIFNERTKDYARLIASIGINATVINNVNVKAEATDFITEEYLVELKKFADLFSSYGIKLFLSLNYAACMEIGGLLTADPLAEDVCKWWEERMALVYKMIPNLGGFLVKADSEGRPGPFTYGRNQADGANMLARAIEPYQGTIIWRCFVYNCQQDWRDQKTDRARAAYDYFYDLDGKFLDNVILQIKNGPMDFQVREPFMPLFGKLQHTNHMMEVQIAQEYTGQQIDICYLIPWFKELLDSKTYNGEEEDKYPDNLLLFFHHVPYTHVLQSKETVIQHIYNTHFEGAKDVEDMVEMWKSLEGKVDELRYQRVTERLSRQLHNAKEWRDQINSYFYRKSAIADEQNRTIY